MKVYSPPEYPDVTGAISIFLGGSIEMGAAPDWQKEFIDKVEEKVAKLATIIPDPIIILNPRRDDWDSDLKQSIKNPPFYQQVDWELTYLERCKHKVFFFADYTISPITLLELGKFAGSNAYVLTQNDYLRKGNVDIFCHKYQIPVFKDIDSIIQKIFNVL